MAQAMVDDDVHRVPLGDHQLDGVGDLDFPALARLRAAQCIEYLSIQQVAPGSLKRYYSGMTSSPTISTSEQAALRTVVVPAAGLGTRFLPATKTVPKELLPVVDTPGIELIAKEAADAGANRLAIVTAPKHSDSPIGRSRETPQHAFHHRRLCPPLQ